MRLSNIYIYMQQQIYKQWIYYMNEEEIYTLFWNWQESST